MEIEGTLPWECAIAFCPSIWVIGKTSSPSLGVQTKPVRSATLAIISFSKSGNGWAPSGSISPLGSFGRLEPPDTSRGGARAERGTAKAGILSWIMLPCCSSAS